MDQTTKKIFINPNNPFSKDQQQSLSHIKVQNILEDKKFIANSSVIKKKAIQSPQIKNNESRQIQKNSKLNLDKIVKSNNIFEQKLNSDQNKYLIQEEIQNSSNERVGSTEVSKYSKYNKKQSGDNLQEDEYILKFLEKDNEKLIEDYENLDPELTKFNNQLKIDQLNKELQQSKQKYCSIKDRFKYAKSFYKNSLLQVKEQAQNIIQESASISEKYNQSLKLLSRYVNLNDRTQESVQRGGFLVEMAKATDATNLNNKNSLIYRSVNDDYLKDKSSYANNYNTENCKYIPQESKHVELIQPKKGETALKYLEIQNKQKHVFTSVEDKSQLSNQYLTQSLYQEQNTIQNKIKDISLSNSQYESVQKNQKPRLTLQQKRKRSSSKEKSLEKQKTIETKSTKLNEIPLPYQDTQLTMKKNQTVQTINLLKNELNDLIQNFQSNTPFCTKLSSSNLYEKENKENLKPKSSNIPSNKKEKEKNSQKKKSIPESSKTKNKFSKKNQKSTQKFSVQSNQKNQELKKNNKEGKFNFEILQKCINEANYNALKNSSDSSRKSNSSISLSDQDYSNSQQIPTKQENFLFQQNQKKKVNFNLNQISESQNCSKFRDNQISPISNSNFNSQQSQLQFSSSQQKKTIQNQSIEQQQIQKQNLEKQIQQLEFLRNQQQQKLNLQEQLIQKQQQIQQPAQKDNFRDVKTKRKQSISSSSDDVEEIKIVQQKIFNANKSKLRNLKVDYYVYYDKDLNDIPNKQPPLRSQQPQQYQHPDQNISTKVQYQRQQPQEELKSDQNHKKQIKNEHFLNEKQNFQNEQQDTQTSNIATKRMTHQQSLDQNLSKIISEPKLTNQRQNSISFIQNNQDQISNNELLTNTFDLTQSFINQQNLNHSSSQQEIIQQQQQQQQNIQNNHNQQSAQNYDSQFSTPEPKKLNVNKFEKDEELNQILQQKKNNQDKFNTKTNQTQNVQYIQDNQEQIFQKKTQRNQQDLFQVINTNESDQLIEFIDSIDAKEKEKQEKHNLYLNLPYQLTQHTPQQLQLQNQKYEFKKQENKYQKNIQEDSYEII